MKNPNQRGSECLATRTMMNRKTTLAGLPASSSVLWRILATLALLLATLLPAQAQQEPPGCKGSGLGIALFVNLENAHVGDTLSYSALVYNNAFPSCKAGDVRAWIVTPDGKTNNLTLTRTTLNPGDSDMYDNVVSYVVRAQDIQDGLVKARATDVAKIYQNDTLSDGAASQGVNTVIYNPCITITQTCLTDVGETGVIRYTSTIRNCGDIDLVNVMVTNYVNGGSALVYGPTGLAIGASATFTGSYTPADPCAPTTSRLVVTARDTITAFKTVAAEASSTCNLALTPGIAISQACAATAPLPGQPLVYTGNVTNTGNITLQDVVVTADQPAAGTVVTTIASLAPGAVAPFTGSFAAPANTCSVTTRLAVAGRSTCGTAVAATTSATCPIVTTPAIAVEKICPTTPVAPGSVLNYTGIVRNTGDVTLRDVRVVSDKPAANTVVFQVASLAPGASANFSAAYRVPADACAATDTLTATGLDVCLSRTVSAQTTTTCPLLTEPKIRVVKVCPVLPVAPGEKLTYAGIVSNPGLVTLNNVVVTSDLPAPGTVVFTAPILLPGATANFTGSFIAPLNSCSAANTLVATATDLCGTASISDHIFTSCPLITTPKLALTRACAQFAVGPGGVTFVSGTVTNTGNITLTNVIVVHSLPTPGTPVFGPVTLEPGEGMGFTGEYVIPANVNSCILTTTLSATGQDVCAGRQTTATVTGSCQVSTLPSIMITKDCSPTPVPQGTIAYYFARITNSGTGILKNIVVYSDQPAENTVVYRLAALAPNTTVQFIGSNFVPFNCCSITTTLRVEAHDNCSDEAVTDTSSTTCPVLYRPAVRITKNCPLKATAPGDKLVYTGTVANPGNITLIDVMVYSSQLGTTAPVLGPIDLAPGETVPYSAQILVASDWCGADTISVTGKSLCGDSNVTDKVTSICPVETSPAVALIAHSPESPVEKCGIITLTGTVSNPGNVNLTDVMVYSNQPTNNTPAFGPITLAAGASANFTFTFKDDGKCGCCELVTTLRVRGKDHCTGRELTATSTTVTPFQTKPSVVINLTCPTVTTVGGIAAYRGYVENTGDIPLTNVIALATLPNTGTKLFGPITLAPGERESFKGSFTVTEGIDVSSLTVSASGVDICNGVVVSNAASCGVDLSRAIDITSIVKGDNGVALTWSAVPGAVYRVQCQSSLNNGTWVDVAGDVTATSSTATKTDPNAPSGRCFYRVMRMATK